MKKILFREIVTTSLGTFTIFHSQNGVRHISLSNNSKGYKTWLTNVKEEFTFQNLTEESNAAKQLKDYAQGKRKNFDCKLDIVGTPFQLLVWKSLLKIPYGFTKSYSWVAKKIGKPRSMRAVGLANSYNPIPIIIPCHRVIGKDGTLTGFGGGLSLKKKLLEHEAINQHFNDNNN